MRSAKHIAGVCALAGGIAALVHFGFSEGWGGVFAAARRTLSSSVGWSESFVAVPLWLVAVFWVTTLTALGGALLVAIHRRRSIVVESPALTRAEIFGLRWRWSYEAGLISELASYCPKCDQPVSPRCENRHGFLQLISYQCVCRKWRSKSFQCSEGEMVERVKQAIAQKTATPAAGRCRHATS